jgi:3-hydroxyisobutyrate dehydrogenase-like beta-hydroxyacid dehydrogenase
MQLGFIGLGQMGKPIALNLLNSGASLVVMDRSPHAFAEFEARGARTATGLDDDLTAADILFLCLPNAQTVQATLVGEAGLLAKLKPGQIVVDLSTIGHSATVEIERHATLRGVGFLDAPVSGMEAGAIAGTLAVMCGGRFDVFEQVRPWLEHIGSKIVFMGPSGSGQLAKLVNQLLLDINAAALAEVLPMAVKLGLDPAAIGEVVNAGTGRSYASEFFIPRILKGHFADGYSMGAAYKDLIGGAEISANLCIPMPVLAAATATYQNALRQGHGEKDKGAMILPFEDILKVQFRGGKPADPEERQS